MAEHFLSQTPWQTLILFGWTSLPIQMPGFSFFPANGGRPYADSWHCQNISVYFLSLPRQRERSLPTVRQDSKKKKKKKVKQEGGSCFAFVFVCKEEALVCFPDSVLENLLDLFHYFSERKSGIFWWSTEILNLLNASPSTSLLYLFHRAEIDVTQKYQY